MPERIQRKRSKGWKMPDNTVYVGRPTKWGNPFIIGKPGGAYARLVKDQRHAWQLYRYVAIDNEKLIAAAQAELRGKNLACFCALPTQLKDIGRQRREDFRDRPKGWCQLRDSAANDQ